MRHFLDKYIIYYADKWEMAHKCSFIFVGLTLYTIQLLWSLWAVVSIPAIIYMGATIHSQDKVLIVKEDVIITQKALIDNIIGQQDLIVAYKNSLEDYYDEVLNSRGLIGIKLKSKRIGKNSFELLAPTDK